MEIIEHKGIGHPDTIADNLSENLSKLLEVMYKKQYGKVQHYNVDKTLVACGKVNYKKGKMVKPVKIVFAGNYTKLKNIKQILKQVVTDTLSTEIKHGLKYKIVNLLSGTSPDLTNNYNKNKSNDTSFAVGHPTTDAERVVLAIAEVLEEKFYQFITEQEREKIGTDFKIMYINNEVTIALAFLNKFKSYKEYKNLKTKLEKWIKETWELDKVQINTADTKNSQFITITGTSLEQGDAGMTGRGNRYNRLITPTKPMTMEAYHGKNNQTHIGKIYQSWAHEMANRSNNKILLINKIGKNIKKPIIFQW